MDSARMSGLSVAATDTRDEPLLREEDSEMSGSGAQTKMKEVHAFDAARVRERLQIEDKGTPLTLETFSADLEELWLSDSLNVSGDTTQSEEEADKGNQQILQRQEREEQFKNKDFVWVDIAAENLDSMEDIELMRALRNSNENLEGVPEWLAEGLKGIEGPVDWLLKIKIKAGAKKGQKVAFKVGGDRAESQYGGNKSTGGFEVFAVQSVEPKANEKGSFSFANFSASFIKYATASDYERLDD